MIIVHECMQNQYEKGQTQTELQVKRMHLLITYYNNEPHV